MDEPIGLFWLFLSVQDGHFKTQDEPFKTIGKQHMKYWVKTFGLLLLILILLPGPMVFSEPVTDKVKRPVEDSIKIRQATQKDREKWSEKKPLLEAEYDSLAADRKRLKEHRQQMQKELQSSRERIAHLEDRIESIEKISEKFIPFLEEVYRRLSDSVDDGLPFLQQERSERLAILDKTLGDPEITMGEKFRKVMEALSIEAEYGNTVEVYQDMIDLEGDEVLVNIFRLGKISLFFESLDQETTGHYNPAENQWERLPRAANRDIRMAVEIGSRQRPADIVTLPLGRIVVE